MPRRINKPVAADRTVDMFSGKTKLEEQYEADRMALDADLANKVNKERNPITIEFLNERLKTYATKTFSTVLEGFRLSRVVGKGDKGVPEGGFFYLERLRNNGTSYSGLYLSEADVAQLASLFTSAASNLDI